MAYGLAFFLFGVALTYQAFRLGGGWLVLLWPAASFFVVAAAYATARPRWLGKRQDGRLSLPVQSVLAPFTAFSWTVAQGHRVLRRGPAACEVAPGIWLGRRARPHEIPAGVCSVVDFTAEFWEPAGVRKDRRYLCVPTLDSTASDEGAFRAALDCVAASDGPVYIHCAQGFGRSAALAAALLIRRGAARDADEAVAMLAKARPGVRLTRRQRDLVRRVTATTKTTSSDPEP
jgi:protein-tyrosine phosphatase